MEIYHFVFVSETTIILNCVHKGLKYLHICVQGVKLLRPPKPCSSLEWVQVNKTLTLKCGYRNNEH